MAGLGDIRRKPKKDTSNKSDGSVGLVGKGLGALGLDIGGHRAATSWGDAARNTIETPMRSEDRRGAFLPIDGSGLAAPEFVVAADRGQNRVLDQAADARTYGNIRPGDQDWDEAKEVSGGSFDAAGLAATGGFAAGLAGAVPEGAIAANGFKLLKQGRDYAVALPDGREVGWFSDIHPQGSGKAIGQMHVDEGFRGQGVARFAHDEIAKDLGTLEPYPHLTDDGKAFWNSYRPGSVSANSPTGASVPLAVNAMERARASRHWPEWGDQFPERAAYFVADTEARHAWKDAVSRAMQRNPGISAKEAEAAAMLAEPEVGQMYHAARRGMLENHKGRPLTKGEEVWESLDRPPGAPDATPEELMNTTVRENFMVLGHPELSRKKLGNSEDLFQAPDESLTGAGAVTRARGGSVTNFIADREGFTPRAAWDYAQYTNGYGTKALHPGEEIDRAEAQRRLEREVAQARAIVDGFAPNADEGTKQALTSLTFNAGDKWTRSGLGQAIQSGDMDRARHLFLQYNKAGGDVLPGLASRRQKEVALFGNPLSESLPQLADANGARDYFSDKPISLTGLQINTPPMALGGPKEEGDFSLFSNPEPKVEPFNSGGYRTHPRNQVSRQPEFAQGPLGLMPKWSDGSMALQGFKAGGSVGLGALSVATPSDAQKEAGNYRKAHVRVQGLDITIENPKGSERSGVDRGGKRWSVKMPDHYGYFKRTLGKDGDHVDCYVGPDTDSQKAFVVNQVDAGTGKFDEHKVMLGYTSEDAARKAYSKAFSDGKAADRIGSLVPVSVGYLKNWLASGDTKKPLGRKAFATGGAVGHVGGLHSDIAGRTDHIPLEVTAGSYIVPADIVSALGEGNTVAGMKVLDHMFPKQAPRLEYAAGGAIPILAAGGEYSLSPEQVAVIGNGDLQAGHALLDAWIVRERQNLIKTLSELPGPAQS